MGSWDFEADSGKQSTLGASLVAAGEKFISDSENMVTTKIGTELAAHWVGDDYTVFAQGAEGYLPALKDLGNTFKLFGEHYKTMSESTGELGTSLISVVEALLTGGAAGSEVGAAGEGMVPEGSDPTGGNENPNSYGGTTFTGPDGTTYETDGDGNVVYSKHDNGDGTYTERYYDADGNYSEVTVDGENKGITFHDRYGNGLGSDYDKDAFNSDGTLKDEYVAEHYGEVGSGKNEFGGYTTTTGNADFIRREKFDAEGNSIELNDYGFSDKHTEYSGRDKDGNELYIKKDENGAIVAASLTLAGATAATDLAIAGDGSKIIDSRLPDSFDAESGELTDDEATKIKNSIDVSRRMTEDEYGEPIDPTPEAADGDGKSDAEEGSGEGTEGESPEGEGSGEGTEGESPEGEGSGDGPGENPEGEGSGDGPGENPEGEGSGDGPGENPEGEGSGDGPGENPDGEATPEEVREIADQVVEEMKKEGTGEYLLSGEGLEILWGKLKDKGLTDEQISGVIEDYMREGNASEIEIENTIASLNQRFGEGSGSEADGTHAVEPPVEGAADSSDGVVKWQDHQVNDATAEAHGGVVHDDVVELGESDVVYRYYRDGHKERIEFTPENPNGEVTETWENQDVSSYTSSDADAAAGTQDTPAAETGAADTTAGDQSVVNWQDHQVNDATADAHGEILHEEVNQVNGKDVVYRTYADGHKERVEYSPDHPEGEVTDTWEGVDTSDYVNKNPEPADGGEAGGEAAAVEPPQTWEEHPANDATVAAHGGSYTDEVTEISESYHTVTRTYADGTVEYLLYDDNNPNGLVQNTYTPPADVAADGGSPTDVNSVGGDGAAEPVSADPVYEPFTLTSGDQVDINGGRYSYYGSIQNPNGSTTDYFYNRQGEIYYQNPDGSLTRATISVLVNPTTTGSGRFNHVDATITNVNETKTHNIRGYNATYHNFLDDPSGEAISTTNMYDSVTYEGGNQNVTATGGYDSVSPFSNGRTATYIADTYESFSTATNGGTMNGYNVVVAQNARDMTTYAQDGTVVVVPKDYQVEYDYNGYGTGIDLPNEELYFKWSAADNAWIRTDEYGNPKPYEDPYSSAGFNNDGGSNGGIWKPR